MNHQNSQAWAVSGLERLNALNSDTLNGCLQTFILAKQVDGLSPRSIVDYQQKIKPFILFCQSTGIDAPKDITLNHVRLYLQKKRESVSPISVKDSFSNVKVWLNWLKHEGVIHENPMSGERPPKVPKRIIQPFTPAHLKELLELCTSGTDYCAARNTAIVLVFIDSGVRLAEMVSMNISSINMEAGTIKVFGKGAKERLVGIGQQSRRAILRYLLFRKSTEDVLWLTEEKKPLQARGIQEIIKRLKRKANIQGVRCSPHTFRHTFADNMVDSGVNVFTLQRLMGHTDLKTTQTYLRGLKPNLIEETYKHNSPVDRMHLK